MSTLLLIIAASGIGALAIIALIIVFVVELDAASQQPKPAQTAKTVKTHITGPFDLHFVGSCGFNIEAKSITLSYNGTIWTIVAHKVVCDFHTEELLRTIFASGKTRPNLEIIAARTVYLVPHPVFSDQDKGNFRFLAVSQPETLPNYQVA